MTSVQLATRARDAIAAHAAAVYPAEACGLLIGQAGPEGTRITRALRCPNLAGPQDQRHRFVIDPRVVINVRRSLRGTPDAILGFYHSHPDAEAVPSATDLEYIRLWPETVWLIAPVAQGEPGAPRAWWMEAREGAAARELGVRMTVVRPPLAACPE